jgi:diadenosine tetraphosphate (Ap4A) HIT family hydrolase
MTVYFEDDKCIAVSEKIPVSRAHFLVVSKDKSITSLTDAPEDVVGHLMLIASKVAK